MSPGPGYGAYLLPLPARRLTKFEIAIFMSLKSGRVVIHLRFRLRIANRLCHLGWILGFPEIETFASLD